MTEKAEKQWTGNAPAYEEQVERVLKAGHVFFCAPLNPDGRTPGVFVAFRSKEGQAEIRRYEGPIYAHGHSFVGQSDNGMGRWVLDRMTREAPLTEWTVGAREDFNAEWWWQEPIPWMDGS